MASGWGANVIDGVGELLTLDGLGCMVAMGAAVWVAVGALVIVAVET